LLLSWSISSLLFTTIHYALRKIPPTVVTLWSWKSSAGTPTDRQITRTALQILPGFIMAQTRQYIGRTKYKKGIIRMMCVYPRFSLSKREQKQAKNDGKQKTKRLIHPIHRRRSWSSFMYGQFFFLAFSLFFPLFLWTTNNHRVYIPT